MLNRVSVTQVTTFRACKRQWWNGYVLKLPKPENASAITGTDCHEILESYQNTGKLAGDPDLLLVVAPCLVNIPPPMTPGVFVEQKFELPTWPGGPTWVGYMDLAWHAPPKHATVVDHKTRSDFRYTMTEEELQVDPQLTCYAKAVMDEWNAETATVAHNYILTPRPAELAARKLARLEGREPAPFSRKPKAKYVSVDVTKPQVEILWETCLETVREMVALEALGPAHPLEAIEPNTTECDKYGGCAFKKQCGFVDPTNPPLFNFLNTRKEQTMTETNGINSGKPIMSAAERLRQHKLKTSGGAAATSAPAQAPAKAAPQESPMMPPDATPDRATLPEAPQEAPKAAQEAEKPAARRGRPPKATQPAQEAPAASQAAPAAATPATQAAPAATPGLTGSLLLVNAAPMKGFVGAVLFDDWFAAAAAEIAAEYQVPHFMLLDFSKEKAAVATKVQELARKGMPAVMALYTRSPGAETALAALTPYVSYIVRG